jgi:thiol:disulfide interchange protein DsbD
VLLLIGAATGAEDPLRPLAALASQDLAGGATLAGGTGAAAHGGGLTWHPVASLDELTSQLQQASVAGEPALLDLYADWCISCKVMERNVFPRPEVAKHLARFRLLRADVTENNDEDKALMNRYGLFGPPSLVFFAGDGSEMSEVRIQGEVDAEALSKHLGAVLAAIDAGKIGDSVAKY